MTNTRKFLHCTEGLDNHYNQKMYLIIISLLKSKSDKNAAYIFDAETTYSTDFRIQWRIPFEGYFFKWAIFKGTLFIDCLNSTVLKKVCVVHMTHRVMRKIRSSCKMIQLIHFNSKIVRLNCMSPFYFYFEQIRRIY